MPSTNKPQHVFLCGIGGSGVSALAPLLMARGYKVSGSDRSHDRGETPDKFAKLAAAGIQLHPQDGSGITEDITLLVVSSAVEPSVPDVKAALDRHIPIKKRAEILAEIFNEADLSIGIGGTSGKSTVTAMTGWILQQAGKNPTIINGAPMVNFPQEGNAVIGDSSVVVAELDESDGSIALFWPRVSVLTNISIDHKPLEELQSLFGAYLAAGQAAVINLDNLHSTALVTQTKNMISFSLKNSDADLYAYNIKPLGHGVEFTLSFKDHDIDVTLSVPGRHNIANALAAMAAACHAGVMPAQSAKILESFKGIKRRFEVMGKVNDITVIDDFGHNPDKIAATLKTLAEHEGRVWAIFQPHGFRPTALMRAELVETFKDNLREQDVLIMPEIYYAGGTAARVISSQDIIEDVQNAGRNAHFIEKRPDIIPFIAANVAPGDRIVVMGARDDTLPLFALDILKALA